MSSSVLPYAIVFGIGIFLLVITILKPKRGSVLMEENERGETIRGEEVDNKTAFDAILSDLSKKIRPESGDLEARLRKSGFKYASVEKFHGNRMMSALIYFVCIVFAGIYFGMNFFLVAGLATAAALYGFSGPEQVLNKALKARRKQLLKEMGFGLESIAFRLSSGAKYWDALLAVRELGLFGKACEYISTQYTLNDNLEKTIAEVKSFYPDTPQFDEFLALTSLQNKDGTNILPSLQMAAHALRQTYKQEIVETGEKVKMKIVMITAFFIVMSTFVVVLAPALFMLIFKSSFF